MNLYLKLAITSAVLAFISWCWFEILTADRLWHIYRPIQAAIAALCLVAFVAAVPVFLLLWVWLG